VQTVARHTQSLLGKIIWDFEYLWCETQATHKLLPQSSMSSCPAVYNTCVVTMISRLLVCGELQLTISRLISCEDGERGTTASFSRPHVRIRSPQGFAQEPPVWSRSDPGIVTTAQLKASAKSPPPDRRPRNASRGNPAGEHIDRIPTVPDSRFQ
jgi:hypothetical protein